MSSGSRRFRGVFTRRRGVPSRARRRLGAAVRMIAALALAGGVYTAFAPGAFAQDNTTQLSATAQEGKQLYDNSCIACHGRSHRVHRLHDPYDHGQVHPSPGDVGDRRVVLLALRGRRVDRAVLHDLLVALTRTRR